MITFLFSNSSEPEYPTLRARLGTILHHSSDRLGVAHVHCYYPKAEAQSKVVIKRQDDRDCSKWYGQIVFYEGWYVSEREKYWWSEKQHIKDCGNCDDLFIEKDG